MSGPSPLGAAVGSRTPLIVLVSLKNPTADLAPRKHHALPHASSLAPGIIFDLIAQLVIALGMAPITAPYHYLNKPSHIPGSLERLNPVPALGPFAIEINLETGNFFAQKAFVRSKYASVGVFSSRESDWNHSPQIERDLFLQHLADAITDAGAVPDFEEVGSWQSA